MVWCRFRSERRLFGAHSRRGPRVVGRAALRRTLAEDYRRRFNNPYYAAGAGYVDDILEPRETRPKLIGALGALRGRHGRP